MNDPSEWWDKVTDEERVKTLATKVMGWEKRFIGHDAERCPAGIYGWFDGETCVAYCQDYLFAVEWNPLICYDHLLDLLKKILPADGELRRFILTSAIGGGWEAGFSEFSVSDGWCQGDVWAKAGTPLRAISAVAFLAAFQRAKT